MSIYRMSPGTDVYKLGRTDGTGCIAFGEFWL